MSASMPIPTDRPLPRDEQGYPIFFEDEEVAETGEASPHVTAAELLHMGLQVHLTRRRAYRAFRDLNCHYLKQPRHPRTGAFPYVSPDLMVVKPKRDLGEDVESYTLGTDGPAPVLVGEVLSQRSAQQRDLTDKVEIYARLGIAEYLLVDTTGKFLKQGLLLKRLGADGHYHDEVDDDGGITSTLGFRAVIDDTGELRLLEARTGKPYPRPSEIGALAAQIERLRAQAGTLTGKGKGKERRR